MADAVNTFFDRAEAYLPKPVYVSPVVSNVIAAVVIAIAITQVWPIIDEDRRANRSATKLTVKARWVGMALGLFATSMVCHTLLSDKIHYVMVLVKNRQHFAYVVFLRKYVDAMRPSTFSV